MFNNLEGLMRMAAESGEVVETTTEVVVESVSMGTKIWNGVKKVASNPYVQAGAAVTVIVGAGYYGYKKYSKKKKGTVKAENKVNVEAEEVKAEPAN